MLSLCVLALRLDVLRYDAWHDPLTGLFDRRSFDRLLRMAIARSTRYGWPFTLVMLDLDHFKTINDEQGHQAGDAVLRDLGERFRRALRFGDNAGRIGGDEFAMILPNTSPDGIELLMERVRTAEGFERPAPAFSYGWAQIPDDASDQEELMAAADRRLYEAKASR
jgi:diguanylate cyclase (GGDEF)-like protein